MTRRFSHLLRARYQETDQMGVVYHGNYLNWLEVGRYALLRELGYSSAALAALDVRITTVSASLKFLRPARYDDVVLVETAISSSDGAEIAFESRLSLVLDAPAVARDERESRTEMLVRGRTRHRWTTLAGAPMNLSVEHSALAQCLREVVSNA